MTKYQVVFTENFKKELMGLDPGVQRQIMQWLHKHLVDVDFPSSPGTTLKGELRDYIRFRVGDYRIVTHVDNHIFAISNLHVAHRKDIYN